MNKKIDYFFIKYWPRPKSGLIRHISVIKTAICLYIDLKIASAPINKEYFFSLFSIETLDKLNQQENHDQQLRALQNVQQSMNRSSMLPRSGHTPEPPTMLKNTLTLAEKKRLQWQQDKGTQHFGLFKLLSNKKTNK